VHHRDLAAVVSDTPTEVFDATRENVLAHERVNEAVMRKHTVIPMCSHAVQDQGRHRRAAARRHDAFQDVLKKMEARSSSASSVVGPRRVIKQIEAEDEDVRRLKAEIFVAEGSSTSPACSTAG